jgi:hypothetical protein
MTLSEWRLGQTALPHKPGTQAIQDILKIAATGLSSTNERGKS